MANSATLLSGLTCRVPDKIRKANIEILSYKVVIDTINTDLMVIAGITDYSIGLVGIHGVPAGAGNQIITDGVAGTALCKLSFAANQGLDYRIGPPIAWTTKGNAFVFQSGVVLDAFLMQFATWRGNLMPCF